MIEEGVCVVPMPEANYPATYKIERLIATWPDRLGFLRPAKVWYRVDVEPGMPVPVPGKGENSWDLDDDAIGSLSVPGRDVETAIAALVASALRTRRRHHGQHMSAPSDG